MSVKIQDCPCGSGKDYRLCCGRYHAGEAAPDAERLMRSRYSAYVLGNEEYLLATWHASARPERLELDTEPRSKWIGLAVKSSARQDETHATVHFLARYRVGGRAHRLEEISRFVLEDGRWYYVEGDVSEA